MIFIDSNIPMYLIGADHPNKRRTISLLERFVRDEERLVSDAEVLQEILHRYAAIQRLDAMQPALDALLGIVDEVFTVSAADMLRAKDLFLAYSSISARDAVHAAVMTTQDISRIFSFDSHFDEFTFLTRIA
ncbi:MAG TPA: type II toxin-antitoxin system VapC family toxin [Clostridia bacterium]|nr:type II toxin-antitoxin system VapC family toxin [Clostridia bacterium]